MSFYVYILASQRNGTLYIGSTDDLVRPGFTDRYAVTRQVWYEAHDLSETAF